MIEKSTESKLFKEKSIKHLTHFVFGEKYLIFNYLKFSKNFQLPGQISIQYNSFVRCYLEETIWNLLYFLSCFETVICLDPHIRGMYQYENIDSVQCD